MRIGDADGVHFAVWAPNAARVSVVGDFNQLGRPRAPDALARLERRVGDLHPRGARRRSATSSRSSPRYGEILLKTDPYGFAFEVPPLSASIVATPDYEWQDDDWMRARRTRGSWFSASDGHLRSASRIVGAHPGGRRPATLTYRRARRPADPVREGDGLHAHRAAAGDGASVLRLVGLSGHRVLRADQPLRHAAATSRRSSTRATEPGIGVILDWVPGHFPEGRPRPRPVRRHVALRARRSAAGRAPRLGHADLQLRPQRGPQLPARERAVLAARVPRRRPARRRGGVDDLSRLLAAAKGSGCRTGSAAARTSRRSTSCGR